MPASPERSRGDRWATLLRSQGWWVQKLPGSSVAGIPDWLRGHADHGLVWTEAKTLEAVMRAKGGLPGNACTKAQQYWLNQLTRYGGQATLLLLDGGMWTELKWLGQGRADEQCVWQSYHAV